MPEFFLTTQTMIIVTCGECGIIYAFTEDFYNKQQKLKERGGFYCPNGHYRCFIGKSDKQKLKNAMKELQKKTECCITAMEQVESLRNTNRALKGHIARLKKKNQNEA